jgi:hypothetical protein
VDDALQLMELAFVNPWLNLGDQRSFCLLR